MKFAHFCAYHAERMKSCESDAFRQWDEMMHRGLQAYVQCRAESALLYLGTALEIGLLRQRCQQNSVFTPLHMLKPAQFLMELFLVERQYEKAEALLAKVSTHSGNCEDAALAHFLAQSFAKVTNNLMSSGTEIRSFH